ncbi:hypothetical protein DFS34DRAFT_591060 [Phlyctochytrium arcticum]|nr:hypothetical protein DFS34DRAFT_591060 [Phlyctochytrium arcticum]
MISASIAKRAPGYRRKTTRITSVEDRKPKWMDHGFPLLYAMTQGNDIKPIVGLIILLVEDLQLLSFAFHEDRGYRGLPHWIPFLFNPLSYEPSTQEQFRGLFYAACAIAVLTLFLTVTVGILMKGSQMKILFIPMLEIFVHTFACTNDMDHADILDNAQSCFTIPYLAQWILSIPTTIYMTIQVPLTVAVFFPINPSGRDPHAKTAGRIEALYSILRILLVFCHEVLVDYAVAPTAALLFLCIVMIFLTARYQPFFANYVNDVRCGIFAAGCGSGIQAAVVVSRGGTDHVGAIIALWLLLIPEFLLGWYISKSFRNFTIRSVMKKLQSRQRQIDEGLVHPQASMADLERNWKRRRSQSFANVPHIVGTAHIEESDIEKNYIANASEILQTRTVQIVRVFKSPFDVEIACRFLQYNSSSQALLLANKIFETGIEQFPASPRLRLMKAYYSAYFHISDVDDTLSCLIAAKKMKPAVDTRFFVYFEERTMEQENRKEDLMISSMNLQHSTYTCRRSRMYLEARTHHLKALLAMRTLWQYWRQDSVILACVPYLLDHIENSRAAADRYYHTLVDKYPNSKEMIGKYASFLNHVTGETDKAHKYEERLRELETDDIRRSAMNLANMRLQAELKEEPVNRDVSMERKHHVQLPPEAIIVEQPSDDFSESKNGSQDAIGYEEQDGSEKTSMVQLAFPENGLDQGGENQSTFSPSQHFKKMKSRSGESGILRGILHSRISMAAAGSKTHSQELILPAHQSIPLFPDLNDHEEVNDKAPETERRRDGLLRTAFSHPILHVREKKIQRELIELKLFSPLIRVRILTIAALLAILAILLAGFSISVIGYRRSTVALTEAYTQARTRSTAMRISRGVRQLSLMGAGLVSNSTKDYWCDSMDSYIKNVWIKDLTPLLYRDFLQDPSTIYVKVTRSGQMGLAGYNHYFLGQHLAEEAGEIVTRERSASSLADIRDQPQTHLFLDNILTIANAFDDTSHGGIESYQRFESTNSQVMYVMLVAIPLATFALGLFSFRPVVKQNFETQLRILSLIGRLPKHLADRRVSDLEKEIQSLVDDLEVDSPGITADIPSLKLFIYLTMLGISGALMFAPGLLQAKFARAAGNTIQRLSDRAYFVTMASALALEAAANDSTVWLPGVPLLWARHYFDQYRAIQAKLAVSTDDSPSLYDFPDVRSSLESDGCLLANASGCDLGMRPYNSSIGFTYAEVTKGLDEVRKYLVLMGRVKSVLTLEKREVHAWDEAVEQFVLLPPSLQTPDHGQLVLGNYLLDDIIDGSKSIAALIVNSVASQSTLQQAASAVIFTLVLVQFFVGYVMVYDRVINKIKHDLSSSIWLLLSLPADFISSNSDLKV